MKQTPCTGCGNRHTVGYLFDKPTIRLCRSCRDVWLTQLATQGFIMADTDWLVAELCEDSHQLDDAAWKFYNNHTKMSQSILRLEKKKVK